MFLGSAPVHKSITPISNTSETVFPRDIYDSSAEALLTTAKLNEGQSFKGERNLGGF